MPQIQEMMRLNPLANYAAWSPRQIAGSNPAYNQLFNQASQMGPALGGLNLIFGDSMQDSGGGMAVPNMGGGAGGAGTGVPISGSMGGQTATPPPPPPQFQPMDIQSIINAEIQKQAAAAVNPQPQLLDPYTYQNSNGNIISGQVQYDPAGSGQQVFIPNDPSSTWTPWITSYFI